MHPDFKQKLLHLSLEIPTLTWTNNTYSFTLLVAVKIFASCMITGRVFFFISKNCWRDMVSEIYHRGGDLFLGSAFFLFIYFIIPMLKTRLPPISISRSRYRPWRMTVIRYPNKDQLKWRQTSILNCHGNIARSFVWDRI